MIESFYFGDTNDGSPVKGYRLSNAHGAYIEVLEYGAIVRTICVSDAQNRLVDVVLGYDTIGEYENGGAYLGACVGRYANRLCGAQYKINGSIVHVTANESANCLHGGAYGFSRRIWQAEIRSDFLRLTRVSPDGEEGFAGELHAAVEYSFAEDNALHIAYYAETLQPTVINLSNHTYFNLAGRGSVLGHTLWINASQFAETAVGMATTGRLLPISGGAMDFSGEKPIGRDIAMPELEATQGYDHCYVLQGTGMRQAAKLCCPQNGIALLVETDAPAMQLYTANYLRETGKLGVQYAPYDAVCMETQNYPDAPNHTGFSSAVLQPGEKYYTETAYRFSTISHADGRLMV